MNIPEQSDLVCLSCGRKNGYLIPLAPVWHFATCTKCRYKSSVTAQTKPDHD